MTELIRKYLKGDRVIWLVIGFLSIYSLLAVFSSTNTLAYKYQGGNVLYYMLKHSVFLVLGLFITFITHLFPYKYYSRLSQLLLFITVPLLLLTLVMGTSLNEASRWLTLPGIGITFQTSDLAKFTLIMYIARELSLRQENIKDFKGAFLPIFGPVILVCGFIFPANFSTAAMLFVVSMVLMFIGRVSIKYILGIAGLGILILAFIMLLATRTGNEMRMGTWQNRIENFVSGDDSDNYQATQSKIAIATGGLFGKGPGQSQQRNFLPHPYSDFIFAIIIEEWGLILGGIPILLLYLFLLFRAGVIVRKCERTFPAFLTMGLAFLIVFQAMINIGVAVNIFPVTGQTLPLVSMGGSSMLFTSVAFGIILNVSRTVDANEEPEDDLNAANDEEN